MFQHPHEGGEIFAHAQFVPVTPVVGDVKQDLRQLQRVRNEGFEVAGRRVVGRQSGDVMEDFLAASAACRHRRFVDGHGVPDGLLAVRFEDLAQNC